MALDDLNFLYRQVIMDHAQSPRNHGGLESPQFTMELLNPTCGDAIQVHASLKDERLDQIRFTGHGCSISLASASMMTQALKGKTVEEAKELIDAFNHLLKGEKVSEENEEKLGDAYYLEGVKKFPARYKCAVLAWKALEMSFSQAGSHLIDDDKGVIE